MIVILPWNQENVWIHVNILRLGDQLKVIFLNNIFSFSEQIRTSSSANRWDHSSLHADSMLLVLWSTQGGFHNESFRSLLPNVLFIHSIIHCYECIIDDEDSRANSIKQYDSRQKSIVNVQNKKKERKSFAILATKRINWWSCFMRLLFHDKFFIWRVWNAYHNSFVARFPYKTSRLNLSGSHSGRSRTVCVHCCYLYLTVIMLYDYQIVLWARDDF